MKHNLLKNNIFWKLTALKFLFFILVGIAGKFFVSKIYNLFILMQTLGATLTGYETLDPELTSLAGIENLREVISQLNDSLTHIIFYSVLLVIIIYIIYLIIDSIAWNLANNKKIKNYKSYFFKFLGISLPVFIILAILGFNLLIYARSFLINYMFEGTVLYSEFFKLFIFFLIITLIFYLLFSGAVYINSNKYIESLKKIFKFRKFYLFPILLIMFIIIFAIIKVGLAISASLQSISIQIIIISMLCSWYKLYMVKKTK